MMEQSRLLDAASMDEEGHGPYTPPAPNPPRPALVNSSCASTISIPSHIKVYRRRWYILFLFALLAFLQGALPNSWAVIAQSAEAAFGWTDATISLMMNWVYITYLVAMAPVAWLMDKKGLRPAVLLSALLVVIGTVIRCISSSPPYVTWLAHVAHITIGLAGPVCFTAGPSISAKWFPPHQRATATALSVVMGYAGAAGSFVVGPSIVEEPSIGNRSGILPIGEKNYTNIEAIKEEIMACRYVECGLAGAIFLALLAYFPSGPPLPPSISAAQDKLDFKHGIRDFFKKEQVNFWLIGLPYGLSVSIYGLWSALFDVNLKYLNIDEREAGWLGFYAVTAGCVAAIIIGWIADHAVMYRKEMLLLLSTCCVGFTFWFILMAQGYIPISTEWIYTAAICQGLFNNGAIPLYYELAMETTYPMAEVVTSAMMTIIYNIIPLIFLLLFWIPGIGHMWMNWCMYGAVLLAFPLVIAFKVQYKRLRVDHLADQDTPRSGVVGDVEPYCLERPQA